MVLMLLASIMVAVEVEASDQLTALKPGHSHPGVDERHAKVVTAALNEKAWQLAPGKQLAFTVRCRRQGRIYVTVRFWSEDQGSKIKLANSDGKGIGPIDHPSSGRIAPNQWFYSTHVLPAELTRGGETVRLQLENNSGKESRGIYQIISHGGSRFEGGADMAEPGVVEPYSFGSHEPPGQQEIDVEAWAEERRKAADRTAEYIISKQRYTSDWRDKVEARQWPGVLVGGFDIQMRDTLRNSKNATGRHYKKRDNGGPMRGVAVLAKAYTLEGGKYEGDPEVLDRIAVGLDYMRRAQGKNGGFVDNHGKGWVGGPSRRRASGALEGRMHRAAATAVLLTYEDLKRKELLGEPVDDDADPETPPVPRHQACRDLLRNSLSYLIRGRGHAPNQELMNVNALAPLYQALKLLGGDEELDQKKLRQQMQQRIAEITGLKPVGRGTVNPYWVSPKGIPMEIGGMSFANYGVRSFWNLAELTGDERIYRRAETVAEALSYFWYPVYHDDKRIDLRQQEAWSRRGTNVRGGTPSADMGAALNGVESHLRAFQLNIMAGHKFGPLDPKKVKAITGYHPHGWNRSVGILNGAKQAEKYVQLFEILRKTDASPLPHEKGQPNFAWVDPVAGAVAIKRGEQHVFMTLMSIDGSDKSRAGVLDVCPRSQRIAVIDIETPHGLPDDLTLATYGPFFLAVNASAKHTRDVTLPQAADGGALKEMVTGKTLRAGAVHTLTPFQSIVVHREPSR